MPPTKAKPSSAALTHSPAIFEDGYGAEVDIWAVGYLIKTYMILDISRALRALGGRICKESHMSAAEVLSLVQTHS